jgi:hypothetical protein
MQSFLAVVLELLPAQQVLSSFTRQEFTLVFYMVIYIYIYIYLYIYFKKSQRIYESYFWLQLQGLNCFF